MQIAPRVVVLSRRRVSRRLVHLLLAAYTGLILALTLWPSNTERPVVPSVFDATRRAGGTPAQAMHFLSILDVVGNVALFVPLGGLLVAALGIRRVLLSVAAGVALSSAVEVAQHVWLPGRDGAVRDVVANGAGAAVGAVLARVTSRQ